MENTSAPSLWTRFWHTPMRAERLAMMRILLGVALLAQQVLEFLPYIPEYYGAEGVAPAGSHDYDQLRYWNWSLLIFNTDDLLILYSVFGLWVAATLAFTLGFCTRLMNVAVWFFTICFLSRNWYILDGGDYVLQNAIFLLMLAPSGKALSVDAWLLRRRGLVIGPVFTPAWPVRLIQIQLCVLYCTTGLIKLKGAVVMEGTWWEGTSIHYALNYLTMCRVSPASLPVPFWMTAAATYVTLFWEVSFPLLVSFRATRWWTLAFGILLHIGIWLTLAIGWFGFYTMSFYAVWLPDEFWERWCSKKSPPPISPKS